jgi:hypothetical protein
MYGPISTTATLPRDGLGEANVTSIRQEDGTFGMTSTESGFPPVDSNHFPSKTWVPLVWTLARVGKQVHYISLTVVGQNYAIDTCYTAEQKWYAEEVDIAFQIDGNYKQQPYSVWLDEDVECILAGNL